MSYTSSVSLTGNSDKFSKHVMRIFDSDGNDFLDFKEFLMAIDIATCETEESKLKWAFKLFDVDNNGSLEVAEMIAVMETLESIDGGCQPDRRKTIRFLKKSTHFILGNRKEFHRITYDDSGNPEPIPTPAERAKDLFEALDKSGDGFLTLEEFVKGYSERNELMARQDAQEQRRKLDCLLLRGSLVPNVDDVPEEKVKSSVANLLYKRTGVDVDRGDLDLVHLRPATEEAPKSAFVRLVFTSL